tara:strand:- start:226 stop:357 length:132 start_codon:yes stop_codon:yes gene_type:complete
MKKHKMARGIKVESPIKRNTMKTTTVSLERKYTDEELMHMGRS